MNFRQICIYNFRTLDHFIYINEEFKSSKIVYTNRSKVQEFKNRVQNQILVERHHLSMEQIDLCAWNSSLSLVKEKTIIVNSIHVVFTIANLPVVLATLAANIWAIFVMNRKETSRVNRLELFFLSLFYFYCSILLLESPCPSIRSLRFFTPSNAHQSNLFSMILLL